MMRWPVGYLVVWLLWPMVLQADQASSEEDRPGLVRCALLTYSGGKTARCLPKVFG